MQFEGSRRSSHVPNLTPLIDIVFLLLIFFMLTSHFVREDSLDIELPEAESGQQLDERKSIEIIINAQGQWLYKDELIDAERLKQVLPDDLSKRLEKRVRIRGDKVSDLGSAVTLLDIAREAGATGVDIVTEKK
jgi:biopolymer transport protein ExbD